MEIIESPEQLRHFSRSQKAESKRVALVPTMGCLHDGHLALVRHAQHIAESVMVSIFVNPTQFGPNEDFEKYPRVFEEDCHKLESLGVDCVFAPTPEQMYPPGFRSNIRVSGISEVLCGASRPGHFDGVATICMKLFQSSEADCAVFGEKDFQQLQVIRTLVRDFDLPIEIVSHPIVREGDGLAMSSRNNYLSDEERSRATEIFRLLSQAHQAIRKKKRVCVGELERNVKEGLQSVGFELDYVEITDSVSLLSLADKRELAPSNSARIFVAAKLGTTRLIDNIALGES